MLTLNTNSESLLAQNSLAGIQNNLTQSIRRLSSGLRVNSAEDDAVALAISQKFQSQIKGVNQSIQNLTSAINLLQTADSGLSTVQDLLLRMNTLATQGLDGSLSAPQKTAIAIGLEDLLDEINATASRTQYNTIHLLDNGYQASSSSSNPIPTIEIGRAHV